jgi:hypothetical protein
MMVPPCFGRLVKPFILVVFAVVSFVGSFSLCVPVQCWADDDDEMLLFQQNAKTPKYSGGHLSIQDLRVGEPGAYTTDEGWLRWIPLCSVQYGVSESCVR